MAIDPNVVRNSYLKAERKATQQHKVNSRDGNYFICPIFFLRKVLREVTVMVVYFTDKFGVNKKGIGGSYISFANVANKTCKDIHVVGFVPEGASSLECAEVFFPDFRSRGVCGSYTFNSCLKKFYLSIGNFTKGYC